MKFTILVDLSLVNIITYLVCLIYLGVEKKIVKKYGNFTLLTSKLPPLWVGVRKFTISCPLPYRCYIQILIKISPVVVNALWMGDDDGRQPIAIGHLSDSGDLKMPKYVCKPSLKKMIFTCLVVDL